MYRCFGCRNVLRSGDIRCVTEHFDVGRFGPISSVWPKIGPKSERGYQRSRGHFDPKLMTSCPLLFCRGSLWYDWRELVAVHDSFFEGRDGVSAESLPLPIGGGRFFVYVWNGVISDHVVVMGSL